jgi:hypothetical protein
VVLRSGRAPAVGAIVLLAAVAAAVLVVWSHRSSPERTVQVVVSGAGPAAAAQQPGIVYGGAGHMVPPGPQSSTAPRSPADAALVLTTPSGQTRRSNQTLPWRQTITLPPGQQVTVVVRSATATSLECMITVDGNQVATQKSSAPGPVTCEARS